MTILATLGTWSSQDGWWTSFLGQWSEQALEGAVTGLGMRFTLGFGSALYFTQPAVRRRRSKIFWWRSKT